MKLFFLFFLLPFAVSAQQDFDYTLYTMHADLTAVDSGKAKLTLVRRIVKEANKFTVMSTNNTGDAIDYKIQFLGVRFGKLGYQSHSIFAGEQMMFFVYSSEGKTIEIWPTIPMVEIHNAFTEELIERYY